MGESNQRSAGMEELFGTDRLAEALRGKVREMIMTLAEAELAEVLAARSYERSAERRGYRNGKRERNYLAAWMHRATRCGIGQL